jgi:hypothetical protein
MEVNGFNPDDLYDQFPSGAETGFGPNEGYCRYRRLNEESIFRPELLNPESPEFDSVLKAFVDSGEDISISYVQFKSSTRESEWAMHKPHLAMAGEVDGIEGPLDRFPGASEARIGTFYINHDQTLAVRKLFTLLMEDGNQCGQMVYKLASEGE